VVDEKQSTHNQLALMDIDNLQLAVGQVHSCPHRVWFVCVCVCVCVCEQIHRHTDRHTRVCLCVCVCVWAQTVVHDSKQHGLRAETIIELN